MTLQANKYGPFCNAISVAEMKNGVGLATFVKRENASILHAIRTFQNLQYDRILAEASKSIGQTLHPQDFFFSPHNFELGLPENWEDPSINQVVANFVFPRLPDIPEFIGGVRIREKSLLRDQSEVPAMFAKNTPQPEKVVDVWIGSSGLPLAEITLQNGIYTVKKVKTDPRNLVSLEDVINSIQVMATQSAHAAEFREERKRFVEERLMQLFL